MASVAESVARLTHPSNQTGRGKSNRRLAPRVGCEWSTIRDLHPDRILTAHGLDVHREAAILADFREAVRGVRRGRAGAVPALADEVEPHTVGPAPRPLNRLHHGAWRMRHGIRRPHPRRHDSAGGANRPLLYRGARRTLYGKRRRTT